MSDQPVIEIEKDVPFVPPAVRHKWGFLRDMAVGDSVYLRGAKAAKLLANATNYYGQKDGRKYTVRRVMQGNEIGGRCHRIS